MLKLLRKNCIILLGLACMSTVAINKEAFGDGVDYTDYWTFVVSGQPGNYYLGNWQINTQRLTVTVTSGSDNSSYTGYTICQNPSYSTTYVGVDIIDPGIYSCDSSWYLDIPYRDGNVGQYVVTNQDTGYILTVTITPETGRVYSILNPGGIFWVYGPYSITDTFEIIIPTDNTEWWGGMISGITKVSAIPDTPPEMGGGDGDTSGLNPNPTPQNGCDPDCTTCPCTQIAGSDGNNPSAVPNTTYAPTKYYNGAVVLNDADVRGSGFSGVFGHNRSYANQTSAVAQYGNGYGWVMPMLPTIKAAGRDSVGNFRAAVIRSGSIASSLSLNN